MTKQFEMKQRAYASDLKSRALSVLIYLIDRSNNEMTCFPAIPTMARELHISISTVKRALHELVEAGFVVKESRFREKNHGQTSNLYILQFPDADPDSVDENNQPVDGDNIIRHDKQVQSDTEQITFESIVNEEKAEGNICLTEQPYQCEQTTEALGMLYNDTDNTENLMVNRGGGQSSPSLNLSG